MNFCLPHTVSNKFLLRADEIYIPNMTMLKEFLEQHKNLSHKCFNICDLISDQDINWLNQKHIDFKVVIMDEFPENYRDKWIKYYFYNPSTTFLDMIRRCRLGVSDVCIHGDLGFYSKDISAIKEHFGIKIRTVPYDSLNESWKKIDSGLTTFWIRPDDIAMYDSIIDTCDILPKEEPLRAETLYELYTHMQDWAFDIADLIVGLDYHINNEIINSEFTRKRLNCQAFCHRGKYCESCETNLNLSKSISKAYFDSLIK
jgi:hypothetical protein